MLRFADLFSGIGGFHLALAGDVELEATCVFASDIDPFCRRTYEEAFGQRVVGDITEITSLSDREIDSLIPNHDVLCAGFPCQSFSKSGFQRGVEEARGTLFYDICRVIEAKAPRYLLLENVMNLVGRRHRDTWATMIRLLRQLGYAVSSEPTVLSPHLLPLENGGSPQSRERVFIPAIRVGAEIAQDFLDLPPLVGRRPFPEWSPDLWSAAQYLDFAHNTEDHEQHGVGGERERAVDIWNQLLPQLGPIQGYPMWADVWMGRLQESPTFPRWKNFLIARSQDAHRQNGAAVESWLSQNDVGALDTSYRKLEWHARDAQRDIWRHAIQFRPSGIRVRPLTYFPALVAIAQTPVVGPLRRRLTPGEAAQLQGFPVGFPLPSIAHAYRLVGNAVHVGATRFVYRRLVLGTAGLSNEAAPERWRQVAKLSNELAA